MIEVTGSNWRHTSANIQKRTSAMACAPIALNDPRRDETAAARSVIRIHSLYWLAMQNQMSRFSPGYDMPAMLVFPAQPLREYHLDPGFFDVLSAVVAPIDLPAGAAANLCA